MARGTSQRHRDPCGTLSPRPLTAPPNRHDADVPDVLGIDVAPALMASWSRWLAPDPQPFLVESAGSWPECADEGGVLTPELEDTYRLWWGVEKGSAIIWISEQQFARLPRPTRAKLVREQVVRRRGAVPTVRGWMDVLDAAQLRHHADGHRFVWWPSLLADKRDQVLTRVVSQGRLRSRHDEIVEAIWRRSEGVLPEARRLAGTFPSGSTTNCFGSVMAAAGAPTAAVYDDVEPFEAWLATACTLGGDVNDPGVVLLWRDRRGGPVHAAVTIGGGWGLEKPSKDWHSPFAAVTVKEIMKMSRHPGERVERHHIA